MPPTYQGTSIKDLFPYCDGRYDGHWAKTAGDAQACAWVEAENVAAVFAVILDWFQAMQNGTAKNRFPDPSWRGEPITEEMADRMIAEADADFEREYHRFPHVKDESGEIVVQASGPEFSRLPPHARIAFAQDIRRVLKTETEILAETKARLAKGEKLPPWTGEQGAAAPPVNLYNPGYDPE